MNLVGENPFALFYARCCRFVRNKRKFSQNNKEVKIIKSIVVNKNAIVIYCLILTVFLILPLAGNQAICVITNNIEPSNIIIIDAGHGGIDSGAVGNGLEEKDLKNMPWKDFLYRSRWSIFLKNILI